MPTPPISPISTPTIATGDAIQKKNQTQDISADRIATQPQARALISVPSPPISIRKVLIEQPIDSSPIKMPAIMNDVEEIEISAPINGLNFDLSPYPNLRSISICDNSGQGGFVVTGLPAGLVRLELHGKDHSRMLDLNRLPSTLCELTLSAPFPSKLDPNVSPLPASLQKITLHNMHFTSTPNFRLFGENLRSFSMTGSNIRGDIRRLLPDRLEQFEFFA